MSLVIDATPTLAAPDKGARALVALCVANFGAMTGYYLLFPAVPLLVAAHGGRAADAGMATAALMAATVLSELAMPALTARFGFRNLFAVGLVLLGAPALLLLAGGGATLVLASCLLRGIGLGMVLTASGALVVAITPPERRSEGMGLSGVVSALPALGALPAAPWLVEHLGFAPVLVTAAAATLAGLALLPILPSPPAEAEAPVGVLAGLRSPAIMAPVLVLICVAMAAGVATTFLPLAYPKVPSGLIAAALLAHALAQVVARGLAGRYGDRIGQRRTALIGIGVAAAGALALAAGPLPAAIVAGGLLTGAGFGLAQNATLSLTFAAVPASAFTVASAFWNLAYDAGLGLGAALFGLVSAKAGYPLSFAMLAGVVAVAVLPALARVRLSAAPRAG